MDTTTIVIVDDHEVVRAGTRMRLETITDIEVAGECDRIASARGLLISAAPVVALVDVRLPDGDGLDLVDELRDHGSETRVVIHSGFGSVELVERALNRGAWGYVLKYSPLETLVDAVRAARDGRRFVDPTIAAEFAMRDGSRTLSDREQQVLRMIADGGQNAGIAHELGISTETVKAHVSSILAKLDADSRTHAVAKAMRDGMIR